MKPITTLGGQLYLKLNSFSVSEDVPGPVVDLKTVLVTKKNIVLTWSDPLDNGGSDILGYEVLRKDAKMKLFRQPIEVASCKCDIQGLLSGEEYDFRVIARNKYGDGAPADLGPILAEDPKGKTPIDGLGQILLKYLKFNYVITLLKMFQVLHLLLRSCTTLTETSPPLL